MRADHFVGEDELLDDEAARRDLVVLLQRPCDKGEDGVWYHSQVGHRSRRRLHNYPYPPQPHRVIEARVDTVVGLGVCLGDYQASRRTDPRSETKTNTRCIK